MSEIFETISIMRKNLGPVTAYKYAVSQGYEGTEQEFAALMASYATVAEEASESAASAAASASAAAESARTLSGAVDAVEELDTAVNGLDLIVNIPKAQDGKNYGVREFYFPIFKGQEITVTNNQDTNNSWQCTLKDGEGATLQQFSVAQNQTKIVTVTVDNAVYMSVYQNVYPLVGRITAESVSHYQGNLVKSVVSITEELDTTVDGLDTTVNELNVVLNGLDLAVNIPKSQDGKTFGTTDFYFPIFKGQEITVTNNQATNSNWGCYLKDGEGATLQQFSVAQNQTKKITVEVDNVVYLRVYQNTYPLVGRITAESKSHYQGKILDSVAGIAGKTTDIVSLNYSVPELIKSSQKLLYGKTVAPLTLLHFSDLHATSVNVARIIQISDSLGELIDDIICTGDMVNDKHADGYTWWGDIEGAEKILTCIGNHDVSDGSNYSAYGITPEQAYNTYFAPYISEWGVEHTGIKTYYYKDYADKKIRLIALDYLLTSDDATAQNTWLQSVLSDAITNNYTVVIIQHCPVTNEVIINCAFSMLGKNVTYNYPTIYQETVQTFIDNGGDFACYLVGHTHWDTIGYNSDYPDQICIAVTCTAITGRDNDQIRVGGTKSQDAANVVTIDTTTHTIKLIRVGANIDNYLRGRNICTIDYKTKQVIAED